MKIIHGRRIHPESAQNHLYLWKLSQKFDFNDQKVSKSTNFKNFGKSQKRHQKCRKWDPGHPQNKISFCWRSKSCKSLRVCEPLRVFDLLRWQKVWCEAIFVTKVSWRSYALIFRLSELASKMRLIRNICLYNSQWKLILQAGSSWKCIKDNFRSIYRQIINLFWWEYSRKLWYTHVKKS